MKKTIKLTDIEQAFKELENHGYRKSIKDGILLTKRKILNLAKEEGEEREKKPKINNRRDIEAQGIISG